jgi:hypothetical protein
MKYQNLEQFQILGEYSVDDGAALNTRHQIVTTNFAFV